VIVSRNQKPDIDVFPKCPIVPEKLQRSLSRFRTAILFNLHLARRSMLAIPFLSIFKIDKYNPLARLSLEALLEFQQQISPTYIHCHSLGMVARTFSHLWCLNGRTFYRHWFSTGKEAHSDAPDAKTTRFEKLNTGSGDAVFGWRYWVIRLVHNCTKKRTRWKGWASVYKAIGVNMCMADIPKKEIHHIKLMMDIENSLPTR